MSTPDTETTTNLALAGEATATPYVLVRPRPGVVGERKRVVHLTPEWPTEPTELVTACCGEQYAAEDLEVLDSITGMPCTTCLLRA